MSGYFPHPRQQRQPHHKKHHQQRHAGLLARGHRRDHADQQRADERGDLSGQREQPKILRDAILRREADEQRARRRLQRTAGAADQASEHEIGALGRAGEQRTAGHRRRHLHEQDRILVDQQDGGERQQQHQHAARDHALRPEAVVELAAEPRPEHAGDRQRQCRRCRSGSCASRTCRRHRCRRTRTATPGRRYRSCWRAGTSPAISASAIRASVCFSSVRPSRNAARTGSFAG